MSLCTLSGSQPGYVYSLARIDAHITQTSHRLWKSLRNDILFHLSTYLPVVHRHHERANIGLSAIYNLTPATPTIPNRQTIVEVRKPP
jgi:hypothetical protein